MASEMIDSSVYEIISHSEILGSCIVAILSHLTKPLVGSSRLFSHQRDTPDTVWNWVYNSQLPLGAKQFLGGPGLASADQKTQCPVVDCERGRDRQSALELLDSSQGDDCRPVVPCFRTAAEYFGAVDRSEERRAGKEGRARG